MQTIKLIEHPLKSYKREFLLQVLRFTTLVLAAFALAILFSNENSRRSFLNPYLMLIVWLGIMLVVALQTFKIAAVSIYQVCVTDGNMHIQWQTPGKIHEVTAPVRDVSAEMVPGGKNTPWLKVTVKKAGGDTVLKQYYEQRWKRDDMQAFINTMQELIQ